MGRVGGCCSVHVDVRFDFGRGWSLADLDLTKVPPAGSQASSGVLGLLRLDPLSALRDPPASGYDEARFPAILSLSPCPRPYSSTWQSWVDF